MTLLDAPTLSPSAIALPSVARIVLIGFMGAGKSTVGNLLARQLNWGFIDTDAWVEERHACTIASMFSQHGERVFRQRESAQLARALGRDKVVIAVGGGAPEVLTNRLLLEQTPATTVIFLDAPFPTLFDRCVLQEGAAVRPVLLDAAAAEQRFQQRLPIYRRCAVHSVATEALAPAATAQQIVQMLG